MHSMVDAPRDRSGAALLSVVVPCFDEAPVLRETHRRVTAVLESAPPPLDFEMIYVDDGSRDETPRILREIQRADARVRVLSLSRNFGQYVAFTAGLHHARGDAVVIMDADLQDPPDLVLAMLDRWRKGVDVVYGVRTQRAGESVFKRWSSKLFHRCVDRIAYVAIPPDSGEFRLMDRAAVDAFLAMPERDRFIRGMVAWTGFRQEPVHFERPARAAGETKYGLGKMMRVAVDGLVSFSFAPLRLALWTGVLGSAATLLGVGSAVAVRILDGAWPGAWTIVFIAVALFGSAQLMILGIFGEYLGRIYNEVKRRPLYVIKERLGFEPANTGKDGG